MRVGFLLSIALVAACGGGGGGDGDGDGPDIDAAAGTADGGEVDGDASADQPDATPPVALQIGTSADEDGSGYGELTAGGDVPMYSGIQGSHHIWSSFRIRRFTGTVRALIDVRRASDDEQIIILPPYTREVASDDDWWESPDGFLTTLCPLGVDVHDVEVVLRMALEDDADGTPLGEWELHVVPQCVGTFCETQCGG